MQDGDPRSPDPPPAADVRPLRHPHRARGGAPVIDRVDVAIFGLRYFTHCLSHPSCRDACCTHGVDVDEDNVARILAHADGLERFTGIERARWFTENVRMDPDFPGGRHRRTRVEQGACVFLDRAGRGCRIHAYCLANGLDYHELKPLVSTLFPLTFDGGLLHPSAEVRDRTLVCLGEGPSLYRGVRDELAYWFGEDLVAELDAVETTLPDRASAQLPGSPYGPRSPGPRGNFDPKRPGAVASGRGLR